MRKSVKVLFQELHLDYISPDDLVGPLNVIHFLNFSNFSASLKLGILDQASQYTW